MNKSDRCQVYEHLWVTTIGFVEEHFDIDAGLNIIQIQGIKLDLVLVINAQEIENIPHLLTNEENLVSIISQGQAIKDWNKNYGNKKSSQLLPHLALFSIRWAQLTSSHKWTTVILLIFETLHTTIMLTIMRHLQSLHTLWNVKFFSQDTSVFVLFDNLVFEKHLLLNYLLI